MSAAAVVGGSSSAITDLSTSLLSASNRYDASDCSSAKRCWRAGPVDIARPEASSGSSNGHGNRDQGQLDPRGWVGGSRRWKHGRGLSFSSSSSNLFSVLSGDDACCSHNIVRTLSFLCLFEPPLADNIVVLTTFLVVAATAISGAADEAHQVEKTPLIDGSGGGETESEPEPGCAQGNKESFLFSLLLSRAVAAWDFPNNRPDMQTNILSKAGKKIVRGMPLCAL